MLISPPFLPPAVSGESDSAWLARAMVQPLARAPKSLALEGSFPVSAAFMWHNGLHLVAPRGPHAALPVRAVADGKVIFVHLPDDECGKDAIAQQYMPDGRESWTDNGCVILRHLTEIGAAGSSPVEVVYYSLYMHLKSIEAGVRKGQPIYRKDALGAAGQFYGATDQLHFEISCDPDYLAAIVGREAEFAELEPPVAPTENGRTDAVFGSLYIYLPPGTPISQTQPKSHVYAPSLTVLEAAQWVEIRYDKGSAFLQSYDPMGAPIGKELPDANFEYELYNEATRRHDSAAKENSASPSSPSGWYELLRFGRNLGPDPLPSYAAHWRQIRTASGSVWADLNAPGTYQFSEADFLPVMGWNFFHDDPTPDDQRCDSVCLKRWIRDPDPSNEHRMEMAQLGARLGDETVRRKLRRAICNFGTEWDRGSIEARHRWLRGPEQGFGLDDDANWERFMTHCRAMSFDDLPDEYKHATWRFHPGEFIAVMRRCGWLSKPEFLRTMPAIYQTNQGSKNTPVVQVTLSIANAQLRLNNLSTPIFMQMCRKYGISSRSRLAHLLSQIYQETGLLRWTQELASGHEYEGRADLGNDQPGDGIRFKGRGLIQTTGRANYKKYSAYRGKQGSSIYTEEPNNNFLATEPYEISDTAGLYWVSRAIRGMGINISRLADRGTDETELRHVTKNVNGAEDGPWTGLVARRSYLVISTAVLLDEFASSTIEQERRTII